jgi:hypothetical protein
MTIYYVDKLRKPAQVGRTYLVPFGIGDFAGFYSEWPVLVPGHYDPLIDDTVPYHYHIDYRFCTYEQVRHMKRAFDSKSLDIIASTSVTIPTNTNWPRYKPLKCLRQFEEATGYFTKLHPAFVGTKLIKSENGWVCPHQMTNLAVVPIIDGTITCPVHGLRWCAKTGKNITIPPELIPYQPPISAGRNIKIDDIRKEPDVYADLIKFHDAQQ